MKFPVLTLLIICCGAGHIILCLASLMIPKVLKWNKALECLPKLLRQLFWTYAGYILSINFCIGILSIIAAGDLLDKSFLARSITFFIGIYWLARVGIQFFYFDKAAAPKGFVFTLGEAALTVLFLLFSLTYLAAFLYNNSWI
jgi:hypothetical protein